jgi:hypothetical protein
MHTCPRRAEHPEPTGPQARLRDEYVLGKCSYCGSISQDAALHELKHGARVDPSSQPHVVYIVKQDFVRRFMLAHLDETGKQLFKEYLK